MVLPVSKLLDPRIDEPVQTWVLFAQLRDEGCKRLFAVLARIELYRILHDPTAASVLTPTFYYIRVVSCPAARRNTSMGLSSAFVACSTLDQLCSGSVSPRPRSYHPLLPYRHEMLCLRSPCSTFCMAKDQRGTRVEMVTEVVGAERGAMAETPCSSFGCRTPTAKGLTSALPRTSKNSATATMNASSSRSSAACWASLARSGSRSSLRVRLQMCRTAFSRAIHPCGAMKSSVTSS